MTERQKRGVEMAGPFCSLAAHSLVTKATSQAGVTIGTSVWVENVPGGGWSGWHVYDEASATFPGGGVGGGPERCLGQHGRRAWQEIKDAVRHGAAAQIPDMCFLRL